MLTLISIIIAAVAGMFALTRQLHMLQQNSYFNSRYLSWYNHDSDGFYPIL